MDGSGRRGSVGVRLIGGLKFVTALLLTAAGFGIFRMLNRDLGEMAEHLVSRLHLDPDNDVVHGLMGRFSKIDSTHLKVIGAGTFFYAILEFVEGIGLILQRRWAGYLTIVATALLLIPELFELAHKVNAVRVVVLVVNLVILVYLVVKVRQEHAARASLETTPVAT